MEQQPLSTIMRVQIEDLVVIDVCEGRGAIEIDKLVDDVLIVVVKHLL